MRTAQENIVDRTAHLEKSVLGCLLEFCSRGSVKELDRVIASGLAAEKFTTSDHRAIFRAMVEIRKQGGIPDGPSLIGELDDRIAAHVWDFTKGVVPENLGRHSHDLWEAWRDLSFSKQTEVLASLTNLEERLAHLDRMRETLLHGGDAENWRSIFHTWEEFEHAAPLRFAINNFLQESGVTLIAGLSGHGKTLIMLAMTKALLEQSPLFGHEAFAVPRAARRVLYLIPESSIGPFKARLQLFRLEDHARSARLLTRTLSMEGRLTLDDPRLLNAVEGADVFLDTAVRFMDGSENDVEGTRPFADDLFRLLQAGARSITGAHHAPKNFEMQDYMSLQNILRGSGDIGAMLCTAWGVRQFDADCNTLYLQNVKPRDFQPCLPFILEGRPHLDNTGCFLMTHKPGEAGDLRSYLRNKSGAGGRPITPDKDSKLRQALDLRAQRRGMREIAKAVGVSKSTIERWFFDYDLSQNRETEFRDSAGIGRG